MISLFCIGSLLTIAQTGRVTVVKKVRSFTKFIFSNDCLSDSCTVFRLTIKDDRSAEFASRDSKDVLKTGNVTLSTKEYDELLNLIKRINTDTLVQFYRTPNTNLPRYSLELFDNFDRRIFIGASGWQMPAPLKRVYEKMFSIMERRKWYLESKN